MATNRHRRTRIYGANFDMGERYYKKQLDDLNNKSAYSRNDLNSHTELPPKEERSTPKVSFAAHDDSYGDSKHRLISKVFEDTDTDILVPIRKKNPVNFNMADDDIDDFISKVRNKKMSRKICFDEFDDDDLPLDFMKKTTFNHKQSSNETDSYTSRFLKDKSSLECNDDKRISIAGLKLKSNELFGEEITRDELAASHRAQATKARLLNLETEIETATKKNKEREKRKETLRKYLVSSGPEREKSVK